MRLTGWLGVIRRSVVGRKEGGQAELDRACDRLGLDALGRLGLCTHVDCVTGTVQRTV